MKRFYELALLLVLAMMLTLTSCKPDEITPKNDKGKGGEVILSIDQLEYQVGEIALIHSNVPLDTTVYFGSIGDQKITFHTVNNDSALTFIVPSMEAGNLEIKFDELNTASSLSFTLIETKLEQPEDIISVFSKNTTDAINMLRDKQNENDNISEKDIQAIEIMQSEFSSLYSQLSEKDKMELAQFLVANDLDKFELNSNKVTDSFLFKKSDEYPSIQWSKIGGTILVDGAAISGLAYGFAGLAAAPDPTLLTKIAAVGAGIVLAAKMVDFLNDMQKLSAFPGIISKIKDIFKKKELEFTAGQEYAFTARNDYRTLTRADNNSNSGFVRSVASTVISINGQWVNFKERVHAIKDWFSGSEPNFETQEVLLDQNARTRSFNGNPDYYKIANVTNDVIISMKVENDQLVFETATTEEKEFKFDLIFNSPKQNLSARKTFFAHIAGNKKTLEVAEYNSGSTTGLTAFKSIHPRQGITLYNFNKYMVRILNNGQAITNWRPYTFGAEPKGTTDKTKEDYIIQIDQEKFNVGRIILKNDAYSFLLSGLIKVSFFKNGEWGGFNSRKSLDFQTNGTVYVNDSSRLKQNLGPYPVSFTFVENEYSQIKENCTKTPDIDVIIIGEIQLNPAITFKSQSLSKFNIGINGQLIPATGRCWKEGNGIKIN